MTGAMPSYLEEANAMFRIYEWNFSSTIDLVVGALLIVTIFAVSFSR